MSDKKTEIKQKIIIFDADKPARPLKIKLIEKLGIGVVNSRILNPEKNKPKKTRLF